MTKVMIGIPSRDGYVHARLVQSLVAQMANRPLSFVGGVVPLEAARNKLVDYFMESDCTHLAMFDADTIPPSNVIDEMLKVGEGIVTAITPIVNKDGITSNIFITEDTTGNVISMEDAIGKKDPFEITAVGLACVLIKREVFESLDKPYFTSLWFQNGEFCEGDVHFCGKAKEAGFKIMAVPSLVCEHVKQFTFSEKNIKLFS